MYIYIETKPFRRLKKNSFLVIFPQSKNNMFLPGVRSTKGGDMGSHGRCPGGNLPTTGHIDSNGNHGNTSTNQVPTCSKTYQHILTFKQV